MATMPWVFYRMKRMDGDEGVTGRARQKQAKTRRKYFSWQVPTGRRRRWNVAKFRGANPRCSRLLAKIGAPGQDSYEAGGCQAPLLFLAFEHTCTAEERVAWEFSDDVNDQDAPHPDRRSIKSWRLRVAGAAPTLLLSVSVCAPSTRDLLVKPGRERPFSNAVSRW
jgi:hypothetical protein